MEGLNKKKEPINQSIPGIRTPEEIVASIRRKRYSGEPLDHEELEHLEKEKSSNDDQPHYGRN